MKLIIDRKRWLRGEGSFMSYLLRPEDNKMCCLGFLGKQCNIEDEDLAYGFIPLSIASEMLPFEKLDEIYKIWPPGLIEADEHGRHDCSAITQQIMELNDNNKTSDKYKEERLIPLFKSLGIDMEFIN